MASSGLLGNEATGRIDDYPYAFGLLGRQRPRQLCAGTLMEVKGAGVKVSFVIKGEKTERDPNDGNRLTVKKLYGDVCHTYSSPRKTGEATARRITEHLVELGTRQAVQTVGLVEQKHAARYSHRLSRSHIKSGNCSRGNSSLSERPCPGILSISPNFSKVSII